MTYIMDHVNEGGRIERKTDRALTIEQLRWAGAGCGMTVLDLGCAAGTTCRMMAGLTGPEGRVVGVDASASRLEEGRGHGEHRPWIEYRQGLASGVPAADGEFDLSWSRFVFEYLPSPREALDEMVRVTKPGGSVVVSDLDGNCVWHHPCDPILRADIDEAVRALGAGFHPRIGIELYSMFVDAGLRDVSVDVRPYHVLAGSVDAERMEQWRMKLEGVALTLEARGWDAHRIARLVQGFTSHLGDCRTFTYSVLISVKGLR